MAEFSYEVKKDYGEISENSGDYQTMVKVISWNNGPEKLDIRKWNTETNKMSKGISLSYDEASNLRDILEEYLNDYE